MTRTLAYHDTQIGRCRSCGAVIEWVVTVDGSRLPFNPPVIFASRLFDDDPTVEVDRARSVSHFTTCPQAAQWRRRHA